MAEAALKSAQADYERYKIEAAGSGHPFLQARHGTGAEDVRRTS